MPRAIKDFYDNGQLHRFAIIEGREIIHLRVYDNQGNEFSGVNKKGWALGKSGELVPPKGMIDPDAYVGVDPGSGPDRTVVTHVSRNSMGMPTVQQNSLPDGDDSDSYRAREEAAAIRTQSAAFVEALQEIYTLARRFSDRDVASGEDLMECIRELEYIAETAIRRVDRDDR